MNMFLACKDRFIPMRTPGNLDSVVKHLFVSVSYFYINRFRDVTGSFQIILISIVLILYQMINVPVLCFHKMFDMSVL